jgi:hypothetical protein
MREFCVAIRKHLKPLVIPKLTRNKIEEITFFFECLHGIPYILGAINGSHVPIITPKVDPKSYYYHKGFYSKLIQGIVDAKCSFWIMTMGGQVIFMIGLFSNKTKLENQVMKDKFSPYKLIGDVAYPM